MQGLSQDVQKCQVFRRQRLRCVVHQPESTSGRLLRLGFLRDTRLGLPIGVPGCVTREIQACHAGLRWRRSVESRVRGGGDGSSTPSLAPSRCDFARIGRLKAWQRPSRPFSDATLRTSSSELQLELARQGGLGRGGGLGPSPTVARARAIASRSLAISTSFIAPRQRGQVIWPRCPSASPCCRHEDRRQ
jgi:hypothetical protein